MNNFKIPLKKIIINYAGRSGSFFIHRLLDGHSNIITFHPEYDLYVYQTLREFFCKKLLLSSLPNYLYQNLNTKFKQNLILPMSTKIDIDMNEIYKEIDNFTKDKHECNYTLDLLIDLFYFCHSIKNLNYINKTDPYVLIQTHEAFEDDELNFFIKNVNLSNLILMLRDPVKSLDSHYYHLKNENNINVNIKTLFTRILIDFSKSTNQIFNRKLLNKIYIIKFEDLHLKSKETLKKLCEKLKIPLEDCLFNETIYGKKTYFFKKKNKNKILNFRKLNIPEKINYLSKTEISIVEKLFHKIINKFNYNYRSKDTRSVYFLVLFYILKQLFCDRNFWKSSWSVIKNFLKILGFISFKGVADI